MSVEIVEIEYMGEIQEHVIIDRGNGEFTSMPKATYDEMIAKQDEGLAK